MDISDNSGSGGQGGLEFTRLSLFPKLGWSKEY